MRTCIKCLVVGIMCSALFHGPLLCQEEEQVPQGVLSQDVGEVVPTFSEGAQGGATGVVEHVQQDALSSQGAGSAPSAGQITAVAPAMNQSVSDAAAPQEEVEIVAPDKPMETDTGIDTLEIEEPGGNWLVKRMWWEKAEEKIEKIEKSIELINDSRTIFYDKRDQLDSNLFEPFYIEIGLDQGQLEEVITYLLQELQEKREKDVVLDREALEFRKKIETEKKVLEDLKVDIASIQKIDIAVDEALDKLVEQINLTRKYRKDAQQLFKDIAKVLDHEKARELYYKMDAAWQNIKGVQDYISGKFTEYVNQLNKNAEEQVSRIKTVMNDLEKKGLSLKDQFKKRKTDAQKEEERKLLAEKLAQEQEAAQGGFWKSAWRIITAPFKMVWGWISSFGSWISSFWSSAPEVQDEQEVESSAKTPEAAQQVMPNSAPIQDQQAENTEASGAGAQQPLEAQETSASIAANPVQYAPAQQRARIETRPMMGQGIVSGAALKKTEQQVAQTPVVPVQQQTEMAPGANPAVAPVSAP